MVIALIGSNLAAETTRGLGLHFGTVSANGFSYRQFTGKNGFQATIGAITLGNNEADLYPDYYGYHNGDPQITVTEEGRRNNVNIGLNYLYTLANNPTGRFYVFGGASYLYSRVKQFERDYALVTGTEYNDHYQLISSYPPRESWENKGYYYVGAGLGFELSLGRGFKWAIEMPITVNEDGEVMMYIPQSGLYYYFN